MSPSTHHTTDYRSPTVRQLRADLALALRAAAHHGLGEGVCNHFSVELPDGSGRFLLNPRGFLWIGTQNGLLRFDGYEFRHFPAGPPPAGLSGAYVRALLAARDGRLLVGTFSGGLSVFDPRTETFRHFRHRPEDPASLSNDRVEGLAEDADGAVWVATSTW